jgi:hypothetical protein
MGRTNNTKKIKHRAGRTDRIASAHTGLPVDVTAELAQELAARKASTTKARQNVTKRKKGARSNKRKERVRDNEDENARFLAPPEDPGLTLAEEANREAEAHRKQARRQAEAASLIKKLAAKKQARDKEVQEDLRLARTLDHDRSLARKMKQKNNREAARETKMKLKPNAPDGPGISAGTASTPFPIQGLPEDRNNASSRALGLLQVSDPFFPVWSLEIAVPVPVPAPVKTDIEVFLDGIDLPALARAKILSVLVSEEMDMDSLMLATMSDFRDLGIKLGPRLRVINQLKIFYQ